jgi:lipopolysaccharide transport system ATP-binding protein
MSDCALEVENLSKLYRLSHLGRQRTLRDAFEHGLQLAWKRLRWSSSPVREEFWALRDVSFSLKQGEVAGIIGRNGAGKSTLLKIVSRITEPTRGRVTMRGRIASLLEVGTGFHPELTGRDNIFLNGAIHGLKWAQIQQKFDQIVEFAEVSRFLDTPVKRYSSGMYVRLAFAVAAHLEPDILIVDEVLAVGDAAFQKKCLGRIGEISRAEGRTVLFVSHNLSSVRQLCSRALLLDGGTLAFDGAPAEAITTYARRNETAIAYKHIAGDGRARITKIDVSSGSLGAAVAVFGDVAITLHYEADPGLGSIECFILLYAEDGECVAASFQSDQAGIIGAPQAKGSVHIKFRNPLGPGQYLVSAGIFDAFRHFHDWVEFAERLEVVPGFANGRAFDQRLGRISLAAEWKP